MAESLSDTVPAPSPASGSAPAAAMADGRRAARSLDPSEALPLKQDRNLGLEMVRAVGVLLVLFAHWGNNISFWFNLGPEPEALLFLGTLAFEFFFVMSGFLIGCLLLDIVRLAPTWRNLLIFLTRRWMRTLPLYYVWLIFLLLVFPPPTNVLGTAIKFVTMTQNFLTPMPEDYFFAVSWSLGIEEWFYISFASVLIVAAMLLPRRAAIWGTLALFLIGPPILRLDVPGFSDWSTGLAKVTVFRLDEIAYGVLMAHLYMQRHWLFRHPLLPFCAGIALIVFYKQVIPPHYFFVCVFTLMAVSCALCLPMVLRFQDAPWWFAGLARRLSAQSYGIYIMHLTLLVDVAQGFWFRHWISAWTAVAIAVMSPFVLSYVSFHFFESPILALRPRQRLGKRRDAGNPLSRLATG